MKIKNAKVYIGTIKECLNAKKYKLYGDKIETVATEWNTMTTKFQCGFQENYALSIEDIIVIKTEYDYFYEFNPTNTLIDNLRIKFEDPYYSLRTNPEHSGSIFLDENTLVPYYEQQPKVLNLRKLKKDLLQDPRIKTSIEH